jgi:hypothetical protein
MVALSNSTTRWWCAYLAATSCVLMTLKGYAEQVEFQLVGPNSLLAEPYIVALGNLPMSAQGVGSTSLTTTYSGTITVDVDNLMNPTAISFISANAAAANSGSWLPGIGGGSEGDPNIQGDATPGTAEPANYGFVINVDLGSGPSVLYVASRDTALSVNTDTVGALPITQGKFDPYGIQVTIPQGTYDGNLSSPDLGDEVTASEPLAGETGFNCTTENDPSVDRCGDAMGSYSVAGNLVTLTLPIDFLIGGGSPEVRFTGTLTATHSLVEPLTGDYNENGVVDAADYVVWRENVGTTNELPNDDIGGTIGPNHYSQWKANFGDSANGTALGNAVPEPATWTLVLFSLLVLHTGLGRRDR